MEDIQQTAGQLVWKDEYSVKVKEIDDQHKQLFDIINNLIKVLNTAPKEETINEIVKNIIKFKEAHFATEEKYFAQFNFEGAEEHIVAHKTFGEKVVAVQVAHQGDTIGFAFALVDFLEDWLIGHLMHMDQKYVECFTKNGLH
jgi:hemerythrin